MIPAGEVAKKPYLLRFRIKVIFAFRDRKAGPGARAF